MDSTTNTHGLTDATARDYMSDRAATLECTCGVVGDEEDLSDHFSEVIESGGSVQ